jgi:hypothetical protein
VHVCLKIPYLVNRLPAPPLFHISDTQLYSLTFVFCSGPGIKGPFHEYVLLTTQSNYICRVQSSVWRLPKYWPPTLLHPASVSFPRTKGGGYTFAGRWGGWGVNILEVARHWINLLQYNPSTLNKKCSWGREGIKMINTYAFLLSSYLASILPPPLSAITISQHLPNLFLCSRHNLVFVVDWSVRGVKEEDNKKVWASSNIFLNRT